MERYAILFVTPFDADTWLVNRATGRHGFGHVALWGGQIERAQPIVLDASTTLRRVDFRPLPDMTRGAPYSRLDLDRDLGRWIFSRALRCVGKPYDHRGLFLGRRTDEAFTCSGLVCCALPSQLEQRCRTIARARTGPASIAPNDLALGLGVPRWGSKP